MKILNVLRSDLERALAWANEVFDGNLDFAIIERVGKTRRSSRGGETWRVRLRVKSSKLPGHRRSGMGRRLPHACWHAHGQFFDGLPDVAIIQTCQNSYAKPGGRWEDTQVGSNMRPLMMSEACDCAKEDCPGELGRIRPGWLKAGVDRPEEGREIPAFVTETVPSAMEPDI